jgi:hypothetical protein
MGVSPQKVPLKSADCSKLHHSATAAAAGVVLA